MPRIAFFNKKSHSKFAVLSGIGNMFRYENGKIKIQINDTGYTHKSYLVKRYLRQKVSSQKVSSQKVSRQKVCATKGISCQTVSRQKISPSKGIFHQNLKRDMDRCRYRSSAARRPRVMKAVEIKDKGLGTNPEHDGPTGGTQ